MGPHRVGPQSQWGPIGGPICSLHLINGCGVVSGTSGNGLDREDDRPTDSVCGSGESCRGVAGEACRLASEGPERVVRTIYC
jgi:hypothetical protein